VEPLTIDTLRTLARFRGLDLTDEELAELLPLVQAGRSMVESLRDVLPADLEPACQYRIL
jgi:hypothetical protein